MGKSPTQQTQTTTQSSQTQPWAEARPLLENAIGALKGQSTDVTSGQSGALGGLQTAANSLPQFGGDTSAAISKMLGFDTSPQVGMLSDLYGTMKNTFAPLTDPSNLNPMNTPGLSDSLNTMTNDITNKVKGVYAGSGRDPSGAGSFAGSLGRGLTQGLAPVLTDQYNKNVGNMMQAATTQANTGSTVAGQMTGQELAPLQQAAQAIGLIPAQAQAALTPGNTQLSVANTAYQLPYGNINALLGPAATLGGMGGTSSGTSTQQMQTPQSTGANIMGGLMGGVGMLSQMGGSAGIAGLAPLLALSDERAKDDVEEIGALHDGQKVYSFRYKDEPKTHIGLLAQEVLEHEPDAVHEMPSTGLLMVDYGRATERASHMRRAA